MDADPRDFVSIGETCRVTGLTPHTLRVWERRYGKPVPHRLPSGHRRFHPDQVRWLRCVREALDLGYRIGKIIHFSQDELKNLPGRVGCDGVAGAEVRHLIDLVRNYERDLLFQDLTLAWRDRGPKSCLLDYLVPFIHGIGRSWVDGDLDVRHEHFATQVLQDFLRTLRQTQPVQAGNSKVLLATLDGEHHEIGLQLVALLFALHGQECRILGTNLAAKQILESVRDDPCRAVGISISLATRGPKSERMVEELREDLPVSVPLLVGGHGSRRTRKPALPGVHYFDHLSLLDDWIQQHAQPRADKSHAAMT